MSSFFWNIDANNQQYFRHALEQGKLRQGWGYNANLNLTLIQDKKSQGLTLTDEEKGAWQRVHYMLDTIKNGDIVFVKHIPDHGGFTVVKVIGDYGFEIENVQNDYGQNDYGHFLPIEILGNHYTPTIPFALIEKIQSVLQHVRHAIRPNHANAAIAQEIVTLLLANETDNQNTPTNANGAAPNNDASSMEDDAPLTQDTLP